MSEYGAPPPPPYGAMPPGPPPGGAPPNNNLIWAILSALLCCMPLGIVSIVFAAQVNGKWAAGDYAGAQASASKAKQFAIASAATSFVIIVLWTLLSIIGAASGGV